MAGGGVVHGTADTSRIEAPVTMKAYLMCAFAAFGGIFFGYDTGWMGGIMGMKSVTALKENIVTLVSGALDAISSSDTSAALFLKLNEDGI